MERRKIILTSLRFYVITLWRTSGWVMVLNPWCVANIGLSLPSSGQLLLIMMEIGFVSYPVIMRCTAVLTCFTFTSCCISLSNSFVVPPTFTISLPDLTSDVDDFNSSIRTIQSSLVGVPNVSGLFSNPRTISPIFTLLGKGRGLFTDSAFSIWNVVSSCASRRHLFHNKLESRYTCTISDEETLWTSVVVSPKAAEPQASASAKFVKPTPFPVRSSYIAPSPKSKSASPVLSTPTLSVSRVSADIPFLPNTSSDGSKKLVVKKKKKTSDR